jgi:rRNA maturation endonuclease Nob1
MAAAAVVQAGDGQFAGPLLIRSIVQDSLVVTGFVCVVLGIGLMLLPSAAELEEKRRMAGHCPKCNYVLPTSSKCPECGWHD